MPLYDWLPIKHFFSYLKYQRRQRVNPASTAGYALNQRRLGHNVPVAVVAQAVGNIKTVQESKDEEGQLPEVIVATTSSYVATTYV